MSVYLPEPSRQLIRRAVEIRKASANVSLSDFIGAAAIQEAKAVIAEHEQSKSEPYIDHSERSA